MVKINRLCKNKNFIDTARKKRELLGAADYEKEKIRWLSIIL